MNYPVWNLPFAGAGMVVAVIAIFHVLVSHFAIGGGAFLFGAELWARKDPQGPAIREWLHKYATFFLVFTTVMGAITGVAIWFSIQLAGPEATSLLIHQFVFVWAIEWVMFVAELTSLYFYYYCWHRNSPGMQVFLAGTYLLTSWLSLVLINAILTFMLTPGDWTLANPDLLAAVFNPTYWPSLILRTVFMLLLGGLFGFLIAAGIKDEAFKTRVVVFCSKWVFPAAVILPFVTYWYWTNLPPEVTGLVTSGMTGLSGGKLEALNRFLVMSAGCSVLILIGTWLVLLKPAALGWGGALALILVAQMAIAGGESFREMARKPWLVYKVIYSNALWKSQADDAEWMKKSFLEKSKWQQGITPLSAEHGEALFRLQCGACHTSDGYRSLKTRTVLHTEESLYNWFDTMASTGVMPPFSGDSRDRAALTAWLLALNGQKIDAAGLHAKMTAALKSADGKEGK